jgi:AcrR family transcriptional regulator
VNPGTRPKIQTKHNLILSAMGLFADQGIDAVSMRTINNAAGTKNASAVHYHFGSKLGIIEAIIHFVRKELDDSRLVALTALENKAAQGQKLTCREIMWAAYSPYALLYTQHEWGKQAVTFLARCQSDLSPEIQDIFNHDPQQIAVRIDNMLVKALPDLPENTRRVRAMYFWLLMVQGFSASQALANTAFGDMRAESQQQSLQRFFDYLLGGMEGGSTPPGQCALE